MPIYEYQCAECGHRLDVIQNFSDASLKQCPECDHASLRKLISVAAFRLKGTGWYATDFRNNDKKKAGDKKDVAEKSDSSGTRAAKSEGEKSEAASDTKSETASGGSD